MEAILGNIEAMVMMYAPVVFVYIVQIVGLIQNSKKIKKLDVKDQVRSTVSPVMSEMSNLTDQLKKLNERNNTLEAMYANMREETSLLSREFSEIQRNINDAIDVQNKILIELVQKNVELNAAVRSKEHDQ